MEKKDKSSRGRFFVMEDPKKCRGKMIKTLMDFD